MKNKLKNLKLIKLIIAILIMSMALLLLSGCKESFALTEILHDQHADEIDQNANTKYARNDDSSNIEDQTLTRKKTTETEKKNDKEKVAADSGSEKNKGKAPKPSATSEKNKNKSSSGNDADKNSNDKSENNSSGSKGTKDNIETGDGDGTTGDPNGREVYDKDGNVVKLPEKVNKVAASGNVAVMVQMLGGSNILSGTDSNIKSGTASSVFSDEGLSDAKTYWSGDGNSPMSSSSFQQLIKDKPDACFYNSGEFSDSQLKQLRKINITPVAVPRFNTASNIQEAATIIGNAIGDRSSEPGGLNAKKQAAKYVDFCEDLVAEVKGRCGLFTYNNTDFNNDFSKNGAKHTSGASSSGQYSLFISGWDDSATLTMKANSTTVAKEQGVAVAQNGYSNSPVSYFLSVAGVLNNAAVFKESNCSEYAVIPLNINVFTPSIKNSSLPYYTPKNESFVRYWDNNDDDGVCLGDKNFTNVVVANNYIRNKIVESGKKSTGLWKSQKRITVGNRTEYGYETHGLLVQSYIHGSYDVIVNPYGVTSWTEGSAESVLESVWAGWRISGDYTENDVKKKIKEFYSTFYRYDLSDASVNAILAGQ